MGIFDMFKKADDSPGDVKGIREAFLRFIKEELQKSEGGEGRNIKGLHLFIACPDAEKHLYESAVYFEDSKLFKNEVQKIADDFALDLPATWTMETTFVDELPTDSLKIPDLNAALFIQTPKHSFQKSVTAYVRVLSAEAEQQQYILNPGTNKVTIGREKKAQVEGGFFRINTIAFPTESTNDCNKFISRQHAHIEWDSTTNCYMLFADEGGVPPSNKVKIKSAGDENQIKLNSTQIGHRLQEGDQIVLGESAILQFSYLEQGE
ncbi:MAG: hypothetical protein JWQ25_2415 [Daejeonella sp.]|nr:hypothetical protein [Daejeonella sp.]